MRKLALALTIALSLGGCADLQSISSGISIVTTSVANPITPTREAQIEQAFDTAIALLNGYKRACVAGSADKNCRANIQAVQVYTRQMTPLITQLRSFVDRNDQVNAVVVYNQVVALYTNFKVAAANVGFSVGDLP